MGDNWKQNNHSYEQYPEPVLSCQVSVPIGSMYSVFTYICLIFMVNVGKYIKYTINGSYGVSFPWLVVSSRIGLSLLFADFWDDFFRLVK